MKAPRLREDPRGPRVPPALQAEWDARLRASGFVDAEKASLTGYDSRLPREYERGMPRQEYYRLAGHWLHDRCWPTRLRKRVWELHADGKDHHTIGHNVQNWAPRGTAPTSILRIIHGELALLRAHYGLVADATMGVDRGPA